MNNPHLRHVEWARVEAQWERRDLGKRTAEEERLTRERAEDLREEPLDFEALGAEHVYEASALQGTAKLVDLDGNLIAEGRGVYEVDGVTPELVKEVLYGG